MTKTIALALLCIASLFSGASAAFGVGTGEGNCTIIAPADTDEFTSGDTIEVVWGSPDAADNETEFEIVLRQCNAFVASSCYHGGYRDDGWNVAKKITAAEFAAGRTAFVLSNDVPSSRHTYVSVESTKYGGVVPDQEWPYIYCISDKAQKFEIIRTAYDLELNEDATPAQWKFDADITVKWTRVNSYGNEVTLVYLEGGEGQNDTLLERSNGVEAVIENLSPSLGLGPRTLRIEWADDESISDTMQVELVPADQYFTIESPSGGTKWVAGADVVVRYTAHSIPAATPISVKLVASGTSYDIGTKTAGAGSIAWKVPASFAVTGLSNYVEISTTGDGEPIKSRSVNFFTQADDVSTCTVKSSPTELVHDWVECKGSGTPAPPILATPAVNIAEMKFEWLWCLGNPQQDGNDYMRFITVYGTAGGSKSASTALQILPGATRRFQVLNSVEHGANLYVVGRNIERTVQTETRKICADFTMYTSDPEDNPGTIGIDLGERVCLESRDKDCECEYEQGTNSDEGDIETCALADPCEPTETDNCNDQSGGNSGLQPRTSRFPAGTDICSKGNLIRVHSTNCKQGDQVLFEVTSKRTPLSVQQTQELPGCDYYWVQIREDRGGGWVLSDEMEACEVQRQVALQNPNTKPKDWTPTIVIASVGGCCGLLLLCGVCGGIAFWIMKRNSKLEQSALTDPYGGSTRNRRRPSRGTSRTEMRRRSSRNLNYNSNSTFGQDAGTFGSGSYGQQTMTQGYAGGTQASSEFQRPGYAQADVGGMQPSYGTSPAPQATGMQPGYGSTAGMQPGYGSASGGGMQPSYQQF